jgi:hypothetical protein
MIEPIQVPNYNVKEDKTLFNRLAIVVIPNESSFGVREDSKVFSTKYATQQRSSTLSFKDLSETEPRSFDKQKIISVELFQSEDVYGSPKRSKPICGFLIKLGANAFCNAKYEVSPTITHPEIKLSSNIFQTFELLKNNQDLIAKLTILTEEQKKMMSLDQVEILVKGINIDRSEQYRFIKERFENGACLMKNQTIPLYYDPENKQTFTPSTQMSFPTNIHLLPVAQSPLQSLQSTSGLTLQNSVKIESSSVPLQVHKLHICSPGENQSDSFEAFVTAGIVTDKTRFCFRSKSASSYLVIQISRETWQADQHGVLQSERLLDFIKELFMKMERKASKP